MQEASFHRLADQTLDTLMQQIESADWADEVDIDLIQGILTITLEDSRKQFVISKHAPSKQLWLSSPISGGLHFSFQETENRWMCKNMELSGHITTEIKALLS